MDKRRKTARLSIKEIPKDLRHPILLFNYEEVKSQIENLSPLGVGLTVDKKDEICIGDVFYLKYYSLEADIKCICVYSDEDGETRSLGAYFTESDEQKIIMKILLNEK